MTKPVLNREVLVKSVAEKSGISIAEAKRQVEAVLGVIGAALENQVKINLVGYFSTKIENVPEKEITLHFQGGKKVTTPAHVKTTMTLAERFKKQPVKK